ncbi:MAG: retropepsin-like domain-containing protein [bacterium]|nr:retropepsin-like domain-containing protein [bacterium]
MRSRLTVIAALTFAVPGNSQDVVFPGGVTSVTRPLVMLSNGNYPGLPCMEIDVNGKPALFMIDSGFGQCAIDKALARELQLEKRGHDVVVGIGGTQKQPIYRGAVFDLDGVTFEPRIIHGLSLRKFSHGRGRRIRGLIGGQFLAKCVLTIDYAGGKVHVHDPDAFEAPADAIEQRLQFSLGQPEIRAVIDDGRPLRYMLDTGAEMHALLFPAFVARHGLADEPERLLAGAVRGHKTAKPAFFGRLERLAIGELENRDVPVMLLAEIDGLAFGADKRRAGILGSALFANSQLTFDYQGRRILVERGHSTGLQPMSGITATRSSDPDSDLLVVRQLLALPRPGTTEPVELRIDDRIVAIDGAPAPTDPTALYRKITRQPITRLTIEREGEERVEVVWRRLGQLPRVALPKR